MKIEAEWLTRSSTQAVMKALGEAWFVGGCVRDALLDLPVADVDVATPLLPEQVIDRAKAAGLRSVPTGIEHGTVTVISKGLGFEVTTFRRDVSTDGRRASVAYSADMAEDAARRDFTINALYADSTGRVVDPLGGLPDLEARHVRFVGEASQRIREDYLRILRFFRFATVYGAGQPFDAKALAAIAANVDGLARLSAERVTSELLKILATPDPCVTLESMARLGVLAQVLPGADPADLPALVAVEQREDVAPDAVRRLAALAADATPLRLARKEMEAHAVLRAELAKDTQPFTLAFQHKGDLATSILILRAALAEVPLPSGWQADVARGDVATFPLRAIDLPDFSGKALGAELNRLKDTWLASSGQISRADLLALSSPSGGTRL